MECIICNNKLKGKQTKYCSPECNNSHGNKNHQSYAKQQERGLKRKLTLIKLLGSKCSKCGYDKNLAALAFHHITPEEKSFQLDMRSLSNRTWDKCQKEAKKCNLLCSNCHLEIHHPHLYLSNLLSS